jgi:drug/metabolite transporter (DMT)-like permease
VTTTAPRPDTVLIALAPAAFVFLWSTGFLGVKLGLPYAEPFTFLGIRFAITTAILFAFALASGVRIPAQPTRVGHAMAAGAMLHFVYIGGVLGALLHGVSAGVVALVVGLQPLITAALVGRVLGERVRAVQWAGLVLGFIGVALVVYAKLAVADATVLGFGYCALGLAGITAGTLYQKRFCAGDDLRSNLVIQLGTAAALCFVCAGFGETFAVTWTGEFVFALLWLAIVVSIGAFTLLMVLLRRGAAARVTSMFYLTPPTTALLGWALFDERLGPLALSGMALAVTGVALVNR